MSASRLSEFVSLRTYRRTVTALAYDIRGRFRSDWSDDQLLDILIPVARAVNPGAPTSVAMRAWDRQRGPALGISDPEELPPTSRAIVMRLNSRGPRTLSWQQWLEVALKEGDERRQSLVAQQRSEAAERPSEARLRFACQLVAQYLGRDTLVPDEYDRGRVELIRRDRRRRQGMPGALAELLPTANQLQRGRDWREVLRVAGLRPPRPRQRGRQGGEVHAGGMSQAEAQVWFVRANRRYARAKELKSFMADCSASLAHWSAGRPWKECYDEAEALLRAAGDPVPADRPAAREPRKLYELPPGGVIPGAPLNKAALRAAKTPEQRQAELRGRCIEGLRRFVAWIAAEHPGVRPTQKRYLAWQVGTEWPAPNNFQQFGGFTALMAEVSGS